MDKRITRLIIWRKKEEEIRKKEHDGAIPSISITGLYL
jgi:hypothetical protein